MPARGIIVAYSSADAVGRIELDDGRELRFGASAMTGGVPIVGDRVHVTETAPHPLGGERALVVQLDAGDRSHERRLGVAVEEHRSAREAHAKESNLTAEALAEAHAARDASFDGERRELEAFHARVQAENLALARQNPRDAIQRREARLRRATSLWRRLFGSRPVTRRYERRLRECGLAPADVDRLLSLVREGASLWALPASTFARGESKFGGLPDVPNGFAWPTSPDGRPLAFVAQLALDRMPSGACRALRLPNRGLLSFFYDAETQPWGSDPSHRSHARVFLFREAKNALTIGLAPAALSVDARFGELRVHAQSTCRLPAPDSPAVVALGLSEPTRRAYAAAFWELAVEEREANDEDADHVFGGHPVPIQGPMMEAQCALVTSGVRVEKTEHLDRRAPGKLEPILERAEGYRLLLQLDSDPSMAWEWGDSGRLYFWMHDDDLAAERFDAAWCILQCS